MADYLHSGFVNSEEEFSACQRFWRDLLDSLAANAGQSEDWVNWQTEAFANGSAFPREFRSMLQARSERLQRAIRVHQSPPASDAVEIAAWFTNYSDFESFPPTTELVINLSLSSEAAEYTRRLLAIWLDPSSSPESLQRLIDELPKHAA